MAVTAETSRVSYTGNNSTVTSYSVPFLFLENSHLAAIAKVTATGVETAVTLANHIGAGNPSGGSVTTAVAVPATSSLTIYRTVPITQTTSYAEGGDFPAASHERALDKLTMVAQQNLRAISACLRGTEGTTSNPIVTAPNTMIGLDNNNAFKAMTLSEVKSYLSLSGVTLSTGFGIKTFANSGERAIAVPEFTGQLGTQRDTADIYIATGTSAGNWSLIDENMSLADFASAFFTADATGRGKFASGFVDTALIADSTSTTTGVTNAKLRQSSALSVIGRSANTTGAPSDIAAANDGEVLRRNGTSIGFGQLAATGITDGAVTPAKLSQPYTLATSVASTSGTSIDFTGIPSWAKRVTVILNNVSTNGTSHVQVQIGSGSFVTSGYASYSAWVGSVNTTSSGITTSGHNIDVAGGGGNAGHSRFGEVRITNITGNTYVFAHTIGIYIPTTAYMACGGGSVALAGAIDRVRITTVNGSDTFDGGTISISYEG